MKKLVLAFILFKFIAFSLTNLFASISDDIMNLKLSEDRNYTIIQAKDIDDMVSNKVDDLY